MGYSDDFCITNIDGREIRLNPENVHSITQTGHDQDLVKVVVKQTGETGNTIYYVRDKFENVVKKFRES